MQPRQPFAATCSCCGRKGLLLRVRGRWQGRVKELSNFAAPAIQLPSKGNGYTLDGFRCWRCRGE